VSVSAVSKLMGKPYRYCYELFTRFLPRLSISIGSFYGVVEVDGVYVSTGLKVRGGGRYEGDKVLSWILILGMDVKIIHL